MESFAYTHLALVAEEAASQKLSNPEVLEFLTKLNLFIQLKPQKHLNKALIYGLCMSLALVPGNGVFTMQLAESKEHANNLVSNSTSKAMLEKSLNSPSQKVNEGIESSSISSPKKENQEKVLLVKKNEGEVNLTNLVDKNASSKISSTTKLIQYTENKSPVSKPNPDARTEPEQKGKLRFINDTPYPGIILFYKPGQQQPYTYLHVPACKKRELYTTYSSWGKVSFNSNEVFSISEASVKKGDFFEIKTSKLANKNSERNSCQDASINQPVINIPPITQIEINSFINTVRYLERILIKENYQYSDRVKRIIAKAESATILEVFTDHLMAIMVQDPKSSRMGDLGVVTDYCKLEKIITQLIKMYVQNEKSINPNKFDRTNYLLDTGERSYLETFISDENNKTTFIQLVELYINAYDALSGSFPKNFYATVGNSQAFNGTGTNPSGFVNSKPSVAENYKCLARLKNGDINIKYSASAPNKKAKVC